MRHEYRDPRQGEVESFLSTHTDWVKAYGDELRFRPCPKCEANKKQNPSVQINRKSGLWRCFTCDAVGNFFQLTQALGHPIPFADRYKEAITDELPRDLIAKFNNAPGRRPVTGGHHKELLEYCHGRGIGNKTLDAFKVSTKGACTLRWPLYAWVNDGWQMCNARLRRCLFKENANATDWFEAKGAPTGLLIGNHLLDLDAQKRVIIFEGQWDVMTAYQIGLRNVFSLPNGATSVKVHDMLRYIPNDWEVWLCLDMDEAGQRGTEKFYAQLGTERVARVVLPAKDLNDWFVETQGELTVQQVEACAKGVTAMVSVQTQPDRDDFLGIDMDADESEHVEVLCKTPWDKLTDLFGGGLRAGETTGLLAPSGMGKTTVVNHFAVYAALMGVKAGVLSLEGSRTSLRKKFKDTIGGMCKREDYPTVIANLMVSPLEGVKTSWGDCIKELESMLKKGARLVIFDNLDFITRGDNQGKIKAYAEVIALATRYSAHAIVVWQPNKIDRNTRVNSGNQKGYSQFLQDADNYLNVNKVGDYRVLDMEKCRETGVDGDDTKVWLLYDHVTRCLQPSADGEAISKDAGNVIDLSNRLG